MTAVAAAPPTSDSRMRSRARVHTALESGADGDRTRLAALRSQAPMSLRPTISGERRRWAEVSDHMASVCLTAAAAGPVGGDELSLDVVVGSGSSLLLTESSATLVLPSRDGAPSVTSVRVRVEPGGTFIWMPRPVIAVQGCLHVNDVAIDLADDARVLIGEQLLLGRKDENSGRVRQEMRVRRGRQSIYVQSLDLGGPTGCSPSVVGRNRAVGTLLVVDPRLERCDPTTLAGDGALLPLSMGGAVVVTALASDNIGLRRQFQEALEILGPPWSAAGGIPEHRH